MSSSVHSPEDTAALPAASLATSVAVVPAVTGAVVVASAAIDVDLVFVKQDNVAQNISVNRHLQPYLWLYVVACESGDLYKKVIRGRLRAWVKERTDKQHQWAIIYVQAAPAPGAPGAAAPAQSSSLASRLTRQRSVWDKLRSDFRRENRCVKIRIAGAVVASVAAGAGVASALAVADSGESSARDESSSDGEADDSEVSSSQQPPAQTLQVPQTAVPSTAPATESRSGLSSSLSVMARPLAAAATLAVPGFARRNDSDNGSDADQWAELTHIFREAFGVCFREALAAYEDELRKLESQRPQPGWNVSLFYAVKEGLAFTYERAGMLREALKQYIELELLLLNKFEQLDRVSAGKSSALDASLIDVARKDFHTAVVEGKVSRSELLQYTLGREVLLLLSMAEPREVTMRVVRFVRSTSRQFLANDPPLAPYFGVCWSYSAYASVADEMERTLRAPIGHYLADLRALACDMLYRLRPLVYADEATRAASAITGWYDRSVRDALGSPAAFNAFYVRHAGTAAQLYIDTKRPRHAVRLHVAMANALLSNPPDDTASRDRGVDLFHAVLARLDADGWHDAYLLVALQLAAAQRLVGALHASTQTIATLVALAARSRQLAASPSCINQWQLLVDVARSGKLERVVEAPFAALGTLSATLGDVNAQGALPRGSQVALRCSMRGCALQRVTFDEIVVEFVRTAVSDDVEGVNDSVDGDDEVLAKTNSSGPAAAGGGANDDDDDDGGGGGGGVDEASTADSEHGSMQYKSRAKARGDYQIDKLTLTASGVSIGTRRDAPDVFELHSAQPINMLSSWRVSRVSARVGQLVFAGDQLSGLAVFDVVPSRLLASIEVPAPVVLVTVGAPQFMYAELHTKTVPFVAVGLRIEVQSKRRVTNSSTKLALLDFADVPVRARSGDDNDNSKNAVETDWRASCKRGRIEVTHPTDPDAVLPRNSVVLIPISLQPKSIPPCTRTLRISWTLVKSSGEVFKRRSHRTVTFNAPFEIVARVPRDGILADAVVLNVLVKSLVDVPLVLTSAVLRAEGSAPHVRAAPQAIVAAGSGSYAFLVQRSTACEAVFEVAFDAPDRISRTFVAPPMQLPSFVPSLYAVSISARCDDLAHVGDVMPLRIELRQSPPTGAATRALVEIEAAPETWIVGGWRARQHEVPGDGTPYVVELPCVPRVAGRVPTPVVSVDGRVHGDTVVVVSGRRILAFNAHRPAPMGSQVDAAAAANSTTPAAAAAAAPTASGATTTSGGSAVTTAETNSSTTASAAAVAAGGE